MKTEDKNFYICQSDCHDRKNVSIYARTEVPINYFFKDENNPELGLYKTCIDCRMYKAEKSADSTEKRKEIAAATGKFFCSSCQNTKSYEERALNSNGSFSVVCIDCKNFSLEYHENLLNIHRTIQKEFINKNECSCQKCKGIFLQPTKGKKYSIKLSTYEKNGIRYVDYNNKIYKTSDFIKQYDDILELRILEFDHLSEKEQNL